ncbi:MAG TPA: PhoH family protein, partial [Thermomicrobiales bacterium]|nr:PhoH family protein [Thermomicrobiales bacterium]
SNVILPQPRNDNQRLYLKALADDPQVVGLGPAGTGKTFLAASMAAFLYLRSRVDRIVVTRPAVDCGEQHGFLPGKLEAKLAPWVRPVFEIIEEQLGKAKVIDMIRDGDLELAPLGMLRGRTLDNAFVILDEAQNATPRQMEMFVTRIGEGTRVVLNGDLGQSDLSGESGLGVAVDLIRNHGVPAAIVEFTEADVVRSGLCKAWVDGYRSRREQGRNIHA